MSLVLAAVAFVAMEPFTAAVHRWVMHGFGWAWHASHHAPRTGRFERNDRFPVCFAAVVGAGLAVGYQVPAVGWLVPLGYGVTAYGACYALVHDGFIHRRLGRLGRPRWATHLADAHAEHHRTGAAPYGMLLPRPADAASRGASSGAVTGGPIR